MIYKLCVSISKDQKETGELFAYRALSFHTIQTTKPEDFSSGCLPAKNHAYSHQPRKRPTRLSTRFSMWVTGSLNLDICDNHYTAMTLCLPSSRLSHVRPSQPTSPLRKYVMSDVKRSSVRSLCLPNSINSVLEVKVLDCARSLGRSQDIWSQFQKWFPAI